MRTSLVRSLLLAVVLSACATEAGSLGNRPDVGDKTERGAPATEPREGKDERPAARARRVDPREGGFEITLGEWAVTPESRALRPGKVTFVVTNRGTMPHGFEIELEGDSSGRGSGDLFKAEGPLLRPGQTTRMTVTLSKAGVYKIECLVDGHDDMGMEGPLEVRRDAPKVAVKGTTAPEEVSIADFAFDPRIIEVSQGAEVTWRNADPTEHTVTASGGGFASVILDEGAVFKHRFDRTGTFEYRCEIHPDMKGQVKVR